MIDDFVKAAKQVWNKLGLKMLSDYVAEGNTEDLYVPEMFEDISGYVANMHLQP
jgi:hypothetical protein